MDSAQKESQLILAIQAIKKDPGLSIRRAATIYTVPESTLRARFNGRQSRRDIGANCRNLTKLEEDTIVQRIIELDSQAFPPRLSAVKNIANRLLHNYNALRVGKNWAFNFIKQQPQLKTVFSRKYDYLQALYKDLKLI